MAAGQTIEKLFLSLGLDMAQLDTDLITAGKTVNQGMADLTRKGQQAKLKMDIDLSRFPDAEKSVEALTIKEKALSAQHDIQKQKVALMNAAYNESVQAKGKDDIASQKILTRLLREQKAEADLAAQIRQTNAARIGLTGQSSNVNAGSTAAASGALAVLASQFNRVRGAGQSAGNMVMAFNTKMLALTAIAASGAGLFSLVKGAVEAGDAAYKLSSRLNLTAAESGQLNRILKLSDVDSQSFISTMIRIDKAVSSAGKSGNATTDALKLFGVSLLDANGSLLPMNQQLEQLAEGYKNAAQAGEEEAYVSEVLGARGAALVPMLRDYAINAEAASRVKTIGIDPKQAHELAVQFQVLNLEAGQMKNVLGMALMPIANEIVPSVISGFDTMIGGIKENKEAIIDTVNIGVELISTIKDISEEILKIPKFAFDLAGIHSAKDALSEFKIEIQELKKHTIIDIVVNDLMNKLPGLKGHIPDYGAEASAQIEMEKEIATAKDAAKIESNKIVANNKKEEQDRTAAEYQARKKEMESAKANAKARIELDDEIYRANHSQFENELHEMDIKKQKLIESGVDEATATEIAETRKGIIIDKNNKEIEKSSKELNDQIYKLSHSSLESRLHDIERERQEWIKKTQDEVKATKWAEQEKHKVMQEEALSAMKENKKYLDIIRNAMNPNNMAYGVTASPGGAKIYDIYQNQADALAGAKRAVLDLMRKENGIGPDDFMTPELLGNYSDVMKWAKDNLVPGLAMDSSQAAQDTSRLQMLMANQYTSSPAAGTARVVTNISPTITVNIQNPQVQNEQNITALADRVADVIQPAIQRAIGDDPNGY